MTVRELIQELEQFNQDLIVVCQSQDETSEPSPVVMKHNFRGFYWDSKMKPIDLPANKEYMVL